MKGYEVRVAKLDATVGVFTQLAQAEVAGDTDADLAGLSGLS